MLPKKQKVGIFTLTHALNYGAFYQMYAMARYFEKYGYEVTVYDCQRTLKYKIIRNFSYHLGRQLRKSILHLKFRKDREAIRIEPYLGQDMDLAILGSDEIWNLKNKSFEHSREYLGLGITAHSIIAYAPSVGYAEPEILIGDDDFQQGLRNSDGILVRDKKTKSIAERVTGRIISEVVDPTILFNSWGELLTNDLEQGADYILYYGYTSTPKFKSALISFAKEKGLKIYTAGFRKHAWCDKNFLIGPSGFLNLMKNAKYVFTDTFHGLVMAVLFDKSICYAAPMQKIRDFSAKIGIDNDELTGTSGRAEIEASLLRDRTDRNRRVIALRTESERLLLKMIHSLASKPEANEL